MIKKAMFQVRLPEELYEKLKTISKREQRSLNNTIEFFLSKSVELYDSTHKLPKE